MRETSDVAKTVRKPISLNHSQSVKKLASQGITANAIKRVAMSASTKRRSERGSGGKAAGARRPEREGIGRGKRHREKTRGRSRGWGGTCTCYDKRKRRGK